MTLLLFTLNYYFLTVTYYFTKIHFIILVKIHRALNVRNFGIRLARYDTCVPCRPAAGELLTSHQNSFIQSVTLLLPLASKLRPRCTRVDINPYAHAFKTYIFLQYILHYAII
jgi:hypothetical protein